MRSRWIAAVFTGLLFFVGMAVFSPSLSADVEGVREAREWLYAGDMARTFRQPVVAYQMYETVADTFPETIHGKVAAKRARAMRATLRRPLRPPTSDDGALVELIDLFLWP